jgi:urease accessory protein
MTIIREALASADSNLSFVRLPVDRLTLAKRRWRGAADDGVEFGFDLEKPLVDGAAFFQTDSAVYQIAQKYEPVLELRLSDCEIRGDGDAARLGWIIGNLHFQIEITPEVIRVADDPALRQLFKREHLPFAAMKRVFHPIAGGHHH